MTSTLTSNGSFLSESKLNLSRTSLLPRRDVAMEGDGWQCLRGKRKQGA